jgi:hypothetical protein
MTYKNNIKKARFSKELNAVAFMKANEAPRSKLQGILAKANTAGFFYQLIYHLKTNRENIADFTKGFHLFTDDNAKEETVSFFHINSNELE